MKLSKILAGAAAAVMMIAALPQANIADIVITDKTGVYGDFSYTVLDGNTVSITKYNGEGGDVEIPAEINDMAVTQIGDGAFLDCRTLESVEIPDGIKRLGNTVFRGCTALKAIELPDSITDIGYGICHTCSSLTSAKLPKGLTNIPDDSFAWCSALESIELPSGITSIGGYAFYNCESLTSVKLPESLDKIWNWAFSSTGLTSVKIPEGVTYIDTVAFANNRYLVSAEIPSSVEYIGSAAFQHCIALTEINVSKENPSFESIDGVVFSREEAPTLLIYPAGKQDTTYTVPDGVDTIGSESFRGAYYIAYINIPDSVRVIDHYAFIDTKGLISVEIPAGVTEIGEGVFNRSTSLTDISVSGENQNYASDDGVLYNKDMTILIQCPPAKEGEYDIPDGVKTIELQAFQASKLTSVTIPDSVTAVKMNAFSDSSIISGQTDTIKYVDNWAVSCDYYAAGDAVIKEGTVGMAAGIFGGYYSGNYLNITSLTIPSTLRYVSGDVTGDLTSTYLDNVLFNYCGKLQYFEVADGNKIYSSADGVLFDKDGTTLIAYPAQKSAKSYTVPDGTTAIAPRAFAYASNLTEVNMAGSVEVINGSAFEYCTELTTVVIGEGVTSIGESVFNNCSKLETLVIPISVTYISPWLGTVSSNLAIYGYPGSYAEEYAKANGINFLPFIPALTNEETGIEIIDANDAVPEGAVLSVTPKDDPEDPEAPDKPVTSVSFDINLVDSEGDKVQPDGEIIVRIPLSAVPDSWDLNNIHVYRQEEDGSYTDMRAYVSGGYIVFTTDHFSEYVLTTVKKGGTIRGDVNNSGGTPNNDDLIALAQYLANWTIEINMEAANVDGDAEGKVNNDDLIMLAQLLAGWKV